MEINNANKECEYMQLGNVLCINSKTAKHILGIRGMSAFECPGESLDLNPIQQVLNIMKMSCVQ